jgi:hypothetical protein
MTDWIEIPIALLVLCIFFSVFIVLLEIIAPAMLVCDDLKMIINENLPEGWVLEEAGCLTGDRLTEDTYRLYIQIAHGEKAVSIDYVESDYWDCRTNGICRVNMETGKTNIPDCLNGWYWKKDC